MPPNRQSIRPEVPVEDKMSNPAEAFQNNCLRPILKLQSELLQAVFLHFMAKRKTPFQKMGRQQQEAQIAHSLSQDKRLRFQLLGIIIGQFTLEEYETYLSMEQEAVRRIFSMMAQRLRDELLEQTAK